MAFDLLILAIIVIILSMLVASLIFTRKSFAPWIPSSKKIIREALQKLPLQPGMLFVDLGAGDGRIVFLAAREFKLNAEGYEISPLPYMYAKVHSLLAYTKQARIFFKNLFNVNLRKYDVIFLFGLTDTLNDKFMHKLKSEVRPGTHIISNYFSLPNKKPIHILRDRWRVVYIYRWE